ncbi:MAG: hypothetical protein Q4D19_01285, partial [Lautropia sp.]|nr:hypothetical protein [Lautropia sp.]
SRLVEKAEKAGDRWRYDKLLPFWVTHVAAQLDGVSLTTVVCSPKGTVTLPPLDAAVAEKAWHGMLRAWAEGICTPLPFAARSGAEWFFERHEQFASGAGESSPAGPDERAVPSDSRASRRYEGDERSEGECARDEHLQRVFPDFAHLWSGGRFADWVECLYGPLIDTVKPPEKTGASRRRGKDGEAAGSAEASGTGDTPAASPETNTDEGGA